MMLLLLACIPPHMMPPPPLPTEPTAINEFLSQMGDTSHLPLDCMADVCLGDDPPKADSEIVNVLGLSMRRSVTECGGSVMRIHLTHVWGDGDAAWYSHDSGEFHDAITAFDSFSRVLEERGWDHSESWASPPHLLSQFIQEKVTGHRFTHPDRQGFRVITATYVWDTAWKNRGTGIGPGLRFTMKVSSTHPDARRVCLEHSGL